MTYATPQAHLQAELARIEALLDAHLDAGRTTTGGRQSADTTATSHTTTRDETNGESGTGSTDETGSVAGANNTDGTSGTDETGSAGRTADTGETDDESGGGEHEDSTAAHVARLEYAVPPAVHERLASQAAEIERRAAATTGTRLRLHALASAFDLSRVHRDVLLLALAPHVDDAFEEQFRRLHDDAVVTEATVGLVEDLFRTPESEPFSAARLLDPDSPLRRYGLVELGEPSGTSSSRRRRRLLPDERVVDYLLGHDGLDPTLSETVSLVDTAGVLSDVDGALTDGDELLPGVPLDPATRDRLDELARATRHGDTDATEESRDTDETEESRDTDETEESRDTDATEETSDDERSPRVVYCYGPEGAGKHRAVTALVDGRVLRGRASEIVAEGHLDRLCREARLTGRAIHLTGIDELHGADATEQTPSSDGGTQTTERVRHVVETVTDAQVDVYLTGRRELHAATSWESPVTTVGFPAPSVDLQQECWAAHADLFAEGVTAATLARTTELTQRQIDAAVSAAVERATEGGATASSESGASADREATATVALEYDEIRRGCVTVAGEPVERYAEQVTPPGGYEDLVVGSDTERQLRSVAAAVRHRGTLADEWGFGGTEASHGSHPRSRGAGVTAGFVAPRDAPTRQSAAVVAAEADTTLYRVDPTRLVAETATETRRRVTRTVTAAERAGCVLLFEHPTETVVGHGGDGGGSAGVDSAESGERAVLPAVRASLRRRDAVVFVTETDTSSVESVLPAGGEYHVTFGRLDEATRETVWRRAVPDATPTASLDYEFLGGLELGRGQIESAVRSAAVAAADDDEPVQMSHVVEACRRELERQGGLIDTSDFGEYSDLIRVDRDESRRDPDAATTETTERADSGSTPSSGDAQSASTSDAQSASSGGSQSESEATGTQPSGVESETTPDVPDNTPPAAVLDSTHAETRPEESTEGEGSREHGSRTTGNQSEPGERNPSGVGEASSGDGEAPSSDGKAPSSDGEAPITDEETTRTGGETTSSDEETTSSDEDTTSTDEETAEAGGASLVGTDPERVVRDFFDYLDRGDGDAAHRLYHTDGMVEKFSRRELIALEQRSTEAEDFRRITESPERVVVRFTQVIGEERRPLEYELRPENGEWRIYSLAKPKQ